jgi:hypothetical protein
MVLIRPLDGLHSITSKLLQLLMDSENSLQPHYNRISLPALPACLAQLITGNHI